MKKQSLLLIIFFLVHSLCLFAQDEPSNENTLKKTNKKKPAFTMDRSFEIGILYFNLNSANSFLSATDIFQEVIIIDLDKLAEGFKFNLGVNFTPFYFNYKSKKGWGLGLSTDISAVGALNLSGNMLNLNEAVKDYSEINGAVFSSATVNTFFDVNKFKIKINPSLFYTLVYITPPRNMPSSVVYTLDYSNGTVMCIDYAMQIYTGYLLEDNKFSITSTPGLDFSIGLEYPFAKEIGLTDAFSILDFDLGLDLISIPFFPSTMTDYMHIKGRIGKDKPIKLINKDDDDDESLISSDEIVMIRGKKYIQVYRPFKMIARADWHPLFGKKFLTVTPIIGFCYNEFYYEPFFLEAGLNACLNFADFFLLKAGFNYTDRMFVNSFGFAFNTKNLEVDIGFDLRAYDMEQLWKGAGFGINFGLKFGW